MTKKKIENYNAVVDWLYAIAGLEEYKDMNKFAEIDVFMRTVWAINKDEVTFKSTYIEMSRYGIIAHVSMKETFIQKYEYIKYTQHNAIEKALNYVYRNTKGE